MPSHLGFHINELADKAAGSPPIGPFPTLHMTIASCLRDNRAAVVHKWRQVWQTFSANKELHLKKKKKEILPNAWDGKGKFFMRLSENMMQYSWFTRLVSGHTPTGEFRRRFFPTKPRRCTRFTRYQSHSHLLTECPRYISKFSSMVAFHVSENNTNKIVTFLKDNPLAFTFEDEPIDLYEPP